MKGYKRYIIGLLIIIYGAYLTVPDDYYFNEMNRAASLQKNTLDPEEPREPEMPSHYLNHFTLTGIDSNDNGVRDDIDIWINRVGKTYNERMALREKARTLNKLLIACDNNDPNAVRDLENKSTGDMHCITFMFLRTPGKELEWEILTNIVFNNNRRNCSSYYSTNSSTSVFRDNKEAYEYCSFKIKNLSQMKTRYENWSKQQ
jgi:hypothetical protein